MAPYEYIRTHICNLKLLKQTPRYANDEDNFFVGHFQKKKNERQSTGVPRTLSNITEIVAKIVKNFEKLLFPQKSSS